jgi:hypothetical protein
MTDQSASANITDGLRITRPELWTRMSPTQKRMAREGQLIGTGLRELAERIDRAYTEDDRVRCCDCERLMGKCQAAYAGELGPLFTRDFTPVGDIRRRCDSFAQR